MRTKVLFAAAIIIATTSAASAQLRVSGTPVAASGALPGDVPTVSVPVPDVEGYRLEDQWHSENDVPVPLRFGAPVPVDVSLENSGRWDVGPDGELVWRIRFESPGAHSLGLELSSYRLPEGAQLFVYDDGLTEIYGAFDHTQNNPDGAMAVSQYPGDAIVVEYKQRADVAAIGQVEISHVIYDYVDFFELERSLDEREAELYSGGGGGVTGGCTIGANCSQFNAYALQKRSAIRTTNFGGLCSASLINNTASNGTPYVYTANHCGQGTSTTFRFKYIQSGCGSGTAPSTFQLTGAQNLATDTDTDGRLMRINQSIPSSYDPYFNGWSRSTSNPSFGLGFHFPNGSPMNGMIDSNGGGKVNVNFQGLGVVQCWSIGSQTGGTQGGSSGSPLMDQNRRTIGCLTGGPASCFTSYYARFYEFWNDTNISQHLDPLGTGQTTLDGHDPSGGGPPPTCGVSNYGTGLAAANIGSLSTSDNPTAGSSFQIDLTGFNGNGTAFLAVATAQTNTSGFGGTLLINPGQALVIFNVPMSNGSGSLTLTLPPAGITGNFQAAKNDGSMPGGWALSNGLNVVICP